MPNGSFIPSLPRLSTSPAPVTTDVGGQQAIQIASRGAAALGQGLQAVAGAVERKAVDVRDHEESVDYANVTARADAIIQHAQVRADNSNNPDDIRNIMDQAYIDIVEFQNGKDANNQPYFRWTKSQEAFRKNLERRRLGLNQYVDSRHDQLNQVTNRSRLSLMRTTALQNADMTKPQSVMNARQSLTNIRNLSPGLLHGVTTSVATKNFIEDTRALEMSLVNKRIDQLGRRDAVSPDEMVDDMSEMQLIATNFKRLTLNDREALKQRAELVMKGNTQKFMQAALLDLTVSDEDSATIRASAEQQKAMILSLKDLDDRDKKTFVRSADIIVKQREATEKAQGKLSTDEHKALQHDNVDKVAQSVDAQGRITMPMNVLKKLDIDPAKKLSLLQSMGTEPPKDWRDPKVQQQFRILTGIVNKYDPDDDPGGKLKMELLVGASQLPFGPAKTNLVKQLTDDPLTGQKAKYKELQKSAYTQIDRFLNLSTTVGVEAAGEKREVKQRASVFEDFGDLNFGNRSRFAGSLKDQLATDLAGAKTLADATDIVKRAIAPLREKKKLKTAYIKYSAAKPQDFRKSQTKTGIRLSDFVTVEDTATGRTFLIQKSTLKRKPKGAKNGGSTQ